VGDANDLELHTSSLLLLFFRMQFIAVTAVADERFAKLLPWDKRELETD